MFDRIKKFFNEVKNLNSSLDNYKEESIIQSLPTVAYVNRAKKLIEEKNYQPAREQLMKALDISKKDSLVYKYLGKICEYEYNFKEAVEYYEQSSKLNENDKEIWLRLGMSLLYSDKPNEAIQAFEKADKVTPMNTDVYTGHGMALMKLKKYALAADKFNKAAQISKYNYTAILLSAVMESRLGEYAKAEEKLTFLTKVAPTESCFYEYSKIKLMRERYQEAEFYAQKAIEYNSKILPAYYVLAEVYSIEKNIERVEKTFSLAISQGLECADLHCEWGRAYIRMLIFDKAEEQFNTAYEKDVKNPFVNTGLALLKSYKNDFSLLEELQERNASNSYIQEAIGVKYFSEGKYKESIEMYKKSLQTDKYQVSNYYNLAKAYEKSGENYKVTEFYEKLFELYPQYVKGLIEYSKFLINISNFEEAKRKLEKVIKADTDNVEALNLLFLCQYTLVNKNVCEYNIKEAISVAKKALDRGRFDYTPKLQELEKMLKETGNN